MKRRLAPVARAELSAYRAVASVVRVALRAAALTPAAPERRRMLAERAGSWRGVLPSGARPCVWLHAASLGEVLTARPLIARLRRCALSARIVVTCQTAAGCTAARDTAADEAHYFPVDTPAALDGILGLLRPRSFLFVETEIWPSLLLYLAERDVPCAMVNASVSERSYSRYRLVRPLLAAALETVAAVCVRDRASHERLLALGADPVRTHATGDLKIDALGEDAVGSTPDLLAGVDGRVLVAASTHEKEEEAVLDAFAAVRARHADARLVLAPRHVARAATALRLARERGFAVGARSERPAAGAWDVMVVDTTGELRGFMKGASAAFVGGSFDSVGGHNLLEPAAFALPIATGPGLGEVREQAELLGAAGALRVVADSGELAAQWMEWLDDPRQAHACGARAAAVVREHAGALERTWSALAPLLERGGVCAAGETGAHAFGG